LDLTSRGKTEEKELYDATKGMGIGVEKNG
jgi:hypothetical protein